MWRKWARIPFVSVIELVCCSYACTSVFFFLVYHICFVVSVIGADYTRDPWRKRRDDMPNGAIMRKTRTS